MKFLVLSGFNKGQREYLENKGLYCYDIREAEDNANTFFGTIEKHVLVNNIGNIVTNEPIQFNTDIAHKDGFVDYEEFAQENEQVEELDDFLQIVYYIEFVDGFTLDEDDEIATEDYAEAEDIFETYKDHVNSFYCIEWLGEEVFEEEYYYERDI